MVRRMIPIQFAIELQFLVEMRFLGTFGGGGGGEDCLGPVLLWSHLFPSYIMNTIPDMENVVISMGSEGGSAPSSVLPGNKLRKG